MNDVFVHQMLYSKKREYLVAQKATKPPQQTNTKTKKNPGIPLGVKQ